MRCLWVVLPLSLLLSSCGSNIRSVRTEPTLREPPAADLTSGGEVDRVQPTSTDRVSAVDRNTSSSRGGGAAVLRAPAKDRVLVRPTDVFGRLPKLRLPRPPTPR